MKRYQWEWCTGRRLSWLRGGGTRWLWATWGEWLGGDRMLFPVLPAPLAARLLRRAAVRWFRTREHPASCALACPRSGCTGSAEKCAACCGRGGER